MPRIAEWEKAFGILAYPYFTNADLVKYSGKCNTWWANIGQRFKLKKEKEQPLKKGEAEIAFAILAYPYYSNKYLADYLKCSKTWLEKLGQKHNLKKAGRFYIGMLDDCQEDNLTGMCFGELLVEKKCSHKRKNNIIWECRCSCGKVVRVGSIILRKGKIDRCKFCMYEIEKNSKEEKNNLRGIDTWWNKFFNDAYIRGKKVTIDKLYIEILFNKQNAKCALTGMDIELPQVRCHKRSGSGSLDRINSQIDYVENNCQWLHKDINMMKQQFDQDYFIKLCCMVADHYRNNNEQRIIG